jgi:regulator of protease activity HflC (stomatin/prohibitin superfamily)
MGRQMKAEREKRAEVLEAEGARNLRSCAPRAPSSPPFSRQKADRDAAYRDAEARERLAEAEAKATRSWFRGHRRRCSKAINYFVAQKYTEALGRSHRRTTRKSF